MSYAVNNVVANAGNYYRCITAGTSAGSGGPTTTSGNITDGTVHWTYMPAWTNIISRSPQYWVEAFSEGLLNTPFSTGYGGLLNQLLRIDIVSGGANYTAPTLTFGSNSGQIVTLGVTNGVITSAAIVNPGAVVNASPVLADSTGNGAILRYVYGGTGSLGSGGDDTVGAVARLPDAIASGADIIDVEIGTNDIVNGAAAATIIANLGTIYATLNAAGIAVIATPLLPRSGLTAAQAMEYQVVNQWIRAYCRGEAWSNPAYVGGVACADVVPYVADPTSAIYAYIGGTGSGNGSNTYDGVHYSARGAFLYGAAVWQAAQTFVGPAPLNFARTGIAIADGYDPVLNPYGNAIEALPYSQIGGSGISVATGALASNSGVIYSALTGGTSAGTGPTAAIGGSSTDGGVTWTGRRPTGLSIGQVSNGGTTTAATGITYTGTPPLSTTILRNTGTASGSVTLGIESPRSDGLPGKRPTFAFSLGSGSNQETWEWDIITGSYNRFGIHPADLGAKYVSLDAELEVDSAANFQGVGFSLTDSSTAALFMYCGEVAAPTVANDVLPPSSGGPIAWPNGGKIVIRCEPTQLPANLSAPTLSMLAVFDASGAANSATATIKVNYLRLSITPNVVD